ncbi:MAG TPA: hypothetical protein PK894_07690 [Defluviitoga sp.]|nr:hypothetical protein [Defluviitoga sp.]HOP24166.1 hypothetical protein [Defluviitoga sp.]HPZ29395.1 hypothetical protein [Defluviitoga sp.]HQD63462.1 hypothetical protein [Defluviitoga sp.]
MLSNEELRQLIWEKSSEIAEKMGLEIFDISIRGSRKNKTVEIIIDNPSDYVSIGDCERFSRTIEPWLDEINIFDSSYYLVVSSPGLDRKLRGRNDYIRFKGKLAKFILKGNEAKAITIIGYIDDVVGEILKVNEKESHKIIEIPLNNIEKANLEIDF